MLRPTTCRQISHIEGECVLYAINGRTKPLVIPSVSEGPGRACAPQLWAYESMTRPLHLVLAEIVRTELFEELPLALFIVLGRFRRDRLRLFEHFLRDKDRRLGAKSESNRVA